ncbi:hypothetical protein EMMF5_003779 [Cystobasidiomycetes sp. EMM_F5]
MTSKQEGFIQSLAEQKGVDVDTAVLNKGDASAKINELKNMPAQGGSGSTTSSDNKQGDAIAQPTESWTTGDDPATQKQRGYIAAMANKAGEDVNLGALNKADASKTIEELKSKTGM